ncbi:MAG: hypothetical protein OEM84_15010 [Acidimicrobiia bacterium]|nr:hypothetical protein [Acidimicrobiia bacterium]
MMSTPAGGLLALFADRDVESGGKDGTWRIARHVAGLAGQSDVH